MNTVQPQTTTQSEGASENSDELSGKNPLSPKAESILRILENCICQVELTAAFPALLKLNNEGGVADNKLSRALTEHQVLTEKVEALETLGQESDGKQDGNDNKEKAELVRDFKNSVRNVLRIAKENPDVINDLKAKQNIEAGESESMLISELKKFHTHMVEKMKTREHEEQEQTHYNPADVMISQKKTEVEDLHQSIEEMDREYEALSIFKPLPPTVKTEKMIRLEQEMDQVNAQLRSLKMEHRRVERAIQEKNERLEAEIELLIQAFDADMEELQAKLDSFEKDYEKDQEEMRMLEGPFSVLEVEYNQVIERKQLEEEKRKQEMRDLELKTKAAIYAQAWWRGYKTRQALRSKSKSKKTKKGKGKKTK
ncbi:dynein regulatory complex protein 10 [Cheilinus undulatus]|uniref:dynein regulatory complex protein 10 n=1 Tax=Cheilinus undulatus TaxID=241271 RepID=UPI001BD1D7F1|nr:dynein regulatory complex protein 10 [Cheilinus undulatus]